MKVKVPAPIEVSTPEIVETAKELVKTEEGLNQLEGLLKKQFTPEKIQQLLIGLCEAEDTRMTKFGPIQTPNWDARKNGLDRVLGLLKYTKKDAVAVDHSATKIVFQIVNNPQAAKP